MAEVSPLPASGAVFFDARDGDRSLRLSVHPDTDTVLLSLWHRGRCVGTFQLVPGDVPRLTYALASALIAGGQGADRAAAPPG